MAKGINIPNIPTEEQTPLIKSLLMIVEQLAETVQHQGEEIRRLKDEISILKGEKKRPKLKPSRMEEQAGKDADNKGEVSVSTVVDVVMCRVFDGQRSLEQARLGRTGSTTFAGTA